MARDSKAVPIAIDFDTIFLALYTRSCPRELARSSSDVLMPHSIIIVIKMEITLSNDFSITIYIYATAETHAPYYIRKR